MTPDPIYRQKLIVAVMRRPFTKSMPNAPTSGTTRYAFGAGP